MKQLFFHELKQSVTKYFFKKCFHGENPEKGEKSTFINVLLSIKIFFYNCASIFNINNSFSIKNDKMSHIENFNHVSHINSTYV